MARNFLTLPFQPYNGAYSSKPFNTGRGAQKGVMVPIDVLWGSYQINNQLVGTANPDLAVVINLNTAGPSTVSGTWTPQSVYIDNDGVDFPVYVFFPDTLFTISCPPNSSGWYEVYTGGRQASVCALGITDNSVTTGERTRLFFTDVVMVPFLDQELASSLAMWIGSTNIQRTNTNLPGYGSPALGDQYVQSPSVDLSIVGFSTAFIGALHSDTPNQNLYITQVQGVMWAMQGANTGVPPVAQCTLRNDVEGVVFNFNAAGYLNTNENQTPTIIVLDMHGNFRFPASRNWFLRTDLSTSVAFGALFCNVVFSISPN